MPHRVERAFAKIVLATALLLLCACGRKHQRLAKAPSAPTPSSPAGSRAPKETAAVPTGYTEEGIASWYGVPYHGRPAADGEIYNMETLVAAHRVLPFNTWLKVTNMSNGKTVTVRVIDRGPFVRGRVLDLSKAAARDIDLLGPGLAKVRLEVVSAPADVPASDFYAVQVGAFANQESAQRVRTEYAERYGTAQLVLKAGTPALWRVLVGKEPSVPAAQRLASLIGTEDRRVFVVRLDQTTTTSDEPR